MGAPIASLRGTRGPTSRSRSSGRPVDLVKFRFPPPPPLLPPPSRTRPSMSVFTGVLSMGRDHLTRRRRVVLYQLHPTNDTARGKCYSRKSTAHGVTSCFFHGRKRRAPPYGMKEEEKRFLFPSRDTISRALNRHVTMTGRPDSKVLESDFII